jgi:hypothetical protein
MENHRCSTGAGDGVIANHNSVRMSFTTGAALRPRSFMPRMTIWAPWLISTPESPLVTIPPATSALDTFWSRSAPTGSFSSWSEWRPRLWLLALIRPLLGQPFFASTESFFHILARHRIRPIVAAVLFPMIVRVIMLPWYPPPRAQIHDEFSYGP